MSASQRRTIIREHKKPRKIAVSYYREAEDALANYLVGEDATASVVSRIRRAVTRSPADTKYQVDRRDACIAAGEAFTRLIPDLPFMEFSRRRGARNSRRLEVNGVSISVRPEVVLETGPKGASRVGAVKLYLSKTTPLTEERAKYGGTILYRYVGERLAKDAEADHKLCFYVDVFARRVFSAPRTYKKRLQDVEAACDEIARSWAFAD